MSVDPVALWSGDFMAGNYGWNYSKRYFDRLMWLSYSGWAWEFRRRLPGLRDDAGHRSLPVVNAAPDGSRFVRLPAPCARAERHGLHFLPDPALSAYDTPVFWLPEVMTTNLDATVQLETRFSPPDSRFSLLDIPGKKSILTTPGRRTKLVVTARSYAAHLAIDGQTSPVPLSIYLTLKIGTDPEMLQKLHCLNRFARFCAGVDFGFRPRRGYAPGALRNALIALDGHLAGASRRQIAGAIFGHALVTEDWDSGVNSYKQRTKRLVDKGLRLMHTDYLKLL